MYKKFITIIAALIAVTMLFGACAVSESQDTATAGAAVDNSASIVIAEVNGNPVYKDAYDAQYASVVQEYTSYGMDPEDEKYASMIQEQCMTALVNEEIFYGKLEELGYMEPTDKLTTRAEEITHEVIDNSIMNYYGTTIMEELGEDYTDEQMAAALDEYDQDILDMNSLTWEQAVEIFIPTAAEEIAFEDFVGDIAPTNAEVEEKYDEYVETYIADLEEDPTIYITDIMNDYTSYYTPAGVRQARQILIMIDEETNSAITLLRQNGFDAQADLLLDTALADIEQVATEALRALQAGGTTFDAAIEQYNEDEDMPENGYPVMEGTEEFVPSFTEGAMALENKKDISELIISDFGYHIIEYYDDETEGAVDYEDVYQEIFDELEQMLQSEAWTKITAQWQEEAVIEYYYENLE